MGPMGLSESGIAQNPMKFVRIFPIKIAFWFGWSRMFGRHPHFGSVDFPQWRWHSILLPYFRPSAACHSLSPAGLPSSSRSDDEEVSWIHDCTILYIHILLGGLEHVLFPHIIIGNNHSNWLSCFSEGLKPPTSISLQLWFNRMSDIDSIYLRIFSIFGMEKTCGWSTSCRRTYHEISCFAGYLAG